MSINQIFVNLPVADTAASKAYDEALGCSVTPDLSDDESAAVGSREGGRPAGRCRAAVRRRPDQGDHRPRLALQPRLRDPHGHRFEAVHLDTAATATPPA